MTLHSEVGTPLILLGACGGREQGALIGSAAEIGTALAFDQAHKRIPFMQAVSMVGPSLLHH